VTIPQAIHGFKDSANDQTAAPKAQYLLTETVLAQEIKRKSKPCCSTGGVENKKLNVSKSANCHHSQSLS